MQLLELVDTRPVESESETGLYAGLYAVVIVPFWDNRQSHLLLTIVCFIYLMNLPPCKNAFILVFPLKLLHISITFHP